ncbi:hypothetical protein BDZ89DRAFT_1150071 [Hymenopellis radicata]|nr:hypothetical protein BDZ89DRAFT_1150071 [Hymenopellis radicata]
MVWKFVPAGDPFGKKGDEYYADDGKLMDIISEMAKGNLEFKWASCGNFTAPHASCNSTKHQNVFLEVTQTGHEMTEDAPCTLAMLESTGYYTQRINATRSSACNVPHTLVRRAGFILQDWYSELVAVDATYGVLFTGNKKIIGVRRRDMQSLYLSKVMNVPQEKSRLKVQAGMMLATLEDIEERSSIVRDQRLRGEIPKHADEFFDIDSTYLPEAIPRTRHPKEAAPEIPSHLRCHMHQLGGFLRRQQEVTLRWSTGLSLLNGLDQPFTIPRYYLLRALVDDKAPVNFEKAEIMIRTQFDKNTFLANLWQPDENQHMGNYFVAKLAHGHNDTEKLREEAAWYMYLRQTNHIGIPQCFGYFESSGVSDFGLLLLEVCDRSLAAQKSIGRGMQTTIRKWLDDLHDSGIVIG